MASRTLVACLFPVLFPLVAGCDRVSGGVSDQGNAIEVAVSDPGSKPLVGATVRIRPSDWVRGSAVAAGRMRDGRTDSLGRFRCERLPQGDYILEAVGDSLVGALALAAPQGVATLAVRADRGASIVLYGLVSGWNVALKGLERTFEPQEDGGIRFSNLPSIPISVRINTTDSTKVLALPAPDPGSTRAYSAQGGRVELDN